MKNFLNTIIECIKYIQVYDYELLNSKKDIIKQYFDEMSEKQQEECLDLLKGNGKETILILSYLLQIIRKPIIQTKIEEVLLKEDIPVLEVLNALFQMNCYLFKLPIEINQKKHYQYQYMIYKKQVEKIEKKVACDIEYIPYSHRNSNKIMIMCRTFLREVHAPTAKIVNICNYLGKLGYEVCVLCTYGGNIEKEYWNEWYDSCVENSAFINTGKICVEYFGVHVSGYIICYTSENFIEETEETLEFIKEYNPAFVLDVGGDNIFSCLAERFTTVCSMACVKKPPLTTVHYIARYFQYTEEEDKEFVACLDKTQRVLEMIHVDELSLSQNGVHKKSDYGIKEDAFVILIAGKRLDDEVTDKVQMMLHEVLKQNENVIIVFVGNCNRLKQIMLKDEYQKNYKFIGEVRDFKGIMKIGDLFLNPPRQGGGTGAYYAIANDVPVLTLDDCDVAQVGKQFVCEKLEDMPKIIKRYIEDGEFTQKQKEYCKERTNILYGINNVENIKKFIDNLEKLIYEREQHV